MLKQTANEAPFRIGVAFTCGIMLPRTAEGFSPFVDGVSPPLPSPGLMLEGLEPGAQMLGL